MKKNGGGTDSSLGPLLGELVLWDTDSPDHECECPGPPPQFYLPPPPRPSSLGDFDCSENAIPHLEACEAVTVIDAEYHFSPAIPSLVIILTVAVVVVVFSLIGTFLVAIKKKKIQNLFPRKSSLQNRCDTASANGVVYEDLTNVRPRTLSPHCATGQTTLSSIEMINVVSYADRTTFSPVFICPKSPVPDSYASQELFNPVYEELSNGSEEKGDTDSEETPQAAVSEDEFAEDELSLGGEPEIRLKLESQSQGGCVQESFCKDVDSSDVDDKSKFLENSQRNLSLQSDLREKGKRENRGLFARGTSKKPKNLDKRKSWRNKGLSSLPVPPVDSNDFHEGLLIKRILQIYPDVTGVGSQYSRGLSNLAHSEEHSCGGARYESLAPFSQATSCRLKPEVISAFGSVQSSAKNQSQDSSLGSDSGYSNNTMGGKPSSRTRKEYRLPNRSEPVLS